MSTVLQVDESAVWSAAERLIEAHRTGEPCAPVRDLIGPDSITAAYAVQQRLTERRIAEGAHVVGRKIGLTSIAVQAQLGVDRPDFGVLFSDMSHVGGDTVPFESVMQPRVEAEIAFVLGHDLDDGPLDRAQIADSIDHAVAALEICGSRVADWDISFADTVADNASAGAYVLGPTRKRLSDFEPRDVQMTMSIDGVEVSTGAGTDCLGDPLEAVVWLARQARDLGAPLRAGQVILSGALGPMKAVAPGTRVTADISNLGRVTAFIGQEKE